MSNLFYSCVPIVYNRLLKYKNRHDRKNYFQEAGFLEAYLILKEVIDPYSPYEYLVIDNSYKLFGLFKIKSTRSETYIELILRLTKTQLEKEHEANT